MTQTPDTGTSHEIVCPHCKKPFQAELMSGGAAARYRGLKCPHCRLFVAWERVDGRNGPAA